MSEFLPGFEANGWYGVGAPKATPTEIVDRLNREINAALADPQMRRRLDELGCAVFAGSPIAIRQVHRRRYRKVEQGSEVCWHQGGLNRGWGKLGEWRRHRPMTALGQKRKSSE